MEIFSSAWHVIVAVLIFCGGAIVVGISRSFFRLSFARAIALYFWHTFFCFFYLWYALSYGGDAITYFVKAQTFDQSFDFGTAGIYYLTAFFVHFFGASIVGVFLVYNIFGTIGLLAIDGAYQSATSDAKPYVKTLATLIVLLPSVSFWTSAIGKDSLSFMAAGLALWAALDLGKRSVLMAFAVVIMMLVRPHMAGLIVVALMFAVVFEKNVSIGKRIGYVAVAVVVAILLVPFALQYAGVGDVVTVGSLNEYIDRRQSYNMEGGGGVDISSMSVPMQLFTYMFRPAFVEINSIFSIAAALDNTILLYLCIVGGWCLLKYRGSTMGNRLFMWAYVIMAWLILSMVTANLGIALRQKWMFAPMLIYLLISVIGKKAPLLKDSRYPNRYTSL